MNPLGARVVERLKAGPIPATEVMALALYDPEHGYYRRVEGPWGFEGKDYYTALDLGPLLGQALALRLEAAWRRLDRPALFTVLEPGAGRGWLGRDLLTAASGDFVGALRYVHRDDNPAARRMAEEALAPWLGSGQASFVAESDSIAPFKGAIVSNELFDALPAQPWKWDGARWVREVLTAPGPEWHAAEDEESRAWFEGVMQSKGEALEASDGSIWCEALPSVTRTLTAALERGLFLAIDYGDSAERLLAKGSDLRRFKGHAVDGKWWEDIGESDLTADVDFTRLQSLLETEGLGEASHQELSKWIRTHAPLMQWEAEWQALPSSDRTKRMENLLQLTLPGLMGARFRVLEAWRS
ncbi:MAG TPA: SAM-dependent methyltransferase [Holophagaceae bacterium]|nr:SAM-dependent methyltransferase [Holophagaceae bacterium]